MTGCATVGDVMKWYFVTYALKKQFQTASKRELTVKMPALEVPS